MASYLGIQPWVVDILERRPPRRTWFGVWNPCNEKDCKGCTLLHYAANQGFHRLVLLFIRHGADTGISDNYKQRVSTAAAEAGHENVMRALLDSGIDPNDCVLGETLFRCAAKEGHAGMAHLLLERGARIDTQTTSNGTALQVAIIHRRTEVVELLVNRGADVNTTDLEGRTLLHLLLHRINGLSQLTRLVTLLLQKGAKIEAKENLGYTPLHTCVPFTNKDVSGAVVILLLQHKADADPETSLGKTALHEAAQKGNFTAAQALLQQEANVNSKTTFGYETLHLASEEGYDDLVELLLNNGASVDARNAQGRTPLMFAKGPKIAELLLGHGADIHALGHEERTALHSVSGYRNEATVEVLLERGADIHASDSDDGTPLHDAARSSQAVVDVLLTCGADINARKKNNDTALHKAAKADLLATVQLLLEREAIVDARAERDETALHYTARYPEDAVGVAEALLKHGADVNAKNEDGETALSIALEEHERWGACGQLIPTLVSNGAYFDVPSEDGKKILHLLNVRGVPVPEWCRRDRISMQQPTTTGPVQTGFVSLLRTALNPGSRSERNPS